MHHFIVFGLRHSSSHHGVSSVLDGRTVWIKCILKKGVLYENTYFEKVGLLSECNSIEYKHLCWPKTLFKLQPFKRVCVDGETVT